MGQALEPTECGLAHLARLQQADFQVGCSGGPKSDIINTQRALGGKEAPRTWQSRKPPLISGALFPVSLPPLGFGPAAAESTCPRSHMRGGVPAVAQGVALLGHGATQAHKQQHAARGAFRMLFSPCLSSPRVRVRDS